MVDSTFVVDFTKEQSEILYKSAICVPDALESQAIEALRAIYSGLSETSRRLNKKLSAISKTDPQDTLLYGSIVLRSGV